MIQKRLLGPDGWTMPVGISELWSNEKIRYEWANGKGGAFYLTGEYIALEPFHKLVHVARMHLPEVTPDTHIETTFEPDGAGTLTTMRNGYGHGNELCQVGEPDLASANKPTIAVG